VGLEVLLGGGDQLDGRELEAAVLEALDDGADQAALLEGKDVRGVFILLLIVYVYVCFSCCCMFDDDDGR
jgi:hypothetical protein